MLNLEDQPPGEVRGTPRRVLGPFRPMATRRWTWITGVVTCPCSCFFRTRRTGFGIWRRGSPHACFMIAWPAQSQALPAQVQVDLGCR
jgi:hypothetical protein